jgi:inner membrane protein COX18
MMSVLFRIRHAQAVQSTLLLSSAHKAHLSPFSPLTSTHPKSHPGHVQRRSFHIIEATQDVIVALHSATGTSWALTIPLFAVGVNLLFRLPFNIYTQRFIPRQSRAVPLLQAMASRIMRDAPRAPVSRGELGALNKKRLRKEMDRVFGALGLQKWKLYAPWLGIPFWLLGIEGIRRLCGASKGLLGLLMGKDAAASPGPEDVGGAPNTSMSSPMLDVNDAVSAGQSAFSSDTMAVSDLANNAAHGLATEGMLWFTNLTVPDPQLILPFAVSAMMFVSVASSDSNTYRKLVRILSNRSGPEVVDEKDLVKLGGEKRGWLRRCLLVLCVVIGPATLHLPAAVHLYWVTSTATHMTSRLLLDIWMPPKKENLKPCKGNEIPVILPKVIKKGPAKTITDSAGEHKQ